MNTQDILTYVSLLPGLILFIKQAVLAVEGPGNGAVKAGAVIEMVQTFIDTTLPKENRSVELVSKLLAFARSTIETYVSLFNKQGVFETPAPPVTTHSEPEVNIQDLATSIAKMERRLAEFKAGSAPDKEKRIANITRNLDEARKLLSKVKPQ